jgi:hypothetical protein
VDGISEGTRGGALDGAGQEADYEDSNPLANACRPYENLVSLRLPLFEKLPLDLEEPRIGITHANEDLLQHDLALCLGYIHRHTYLVTELYRIPGFSLRNLIPGFKVVFPVLRIAILGEFSSKVLTFCR